MPTPNPRLKYWLLNALSIVIAEVTRSLADSTTGFAEWVWYVGNYVAMVTNGVSFALALGLVKTAGSPGRTNLHARVSDNFNQERQEAKDLSANKHIAPYLSRYRAFLDRRAGRNPEFSGWLTAQFHEQFRDLGIRSLYPNWVFATDGAMAFRLASKTDTGAVMNAVFKHIECSGNALTAYLEPTAKSYSLRQIANALQDLLNQIPTALAEARAKTNARLEAQLDWDALSNRGATALKPFGKLAEKKL
jgi:hypothetical protein